MIADPLQLPSDSTLLRRFVSAFRIDTGLSPVELLTQLVTAFAQLPYENLTKIIKEANTGSVEEARRHPAEVFADHLQLGTGGTCFSLTATLLHLVRSLGWRAEPILADRRYGPDTHCALLVWIDGQPHLLDPGYLIVRPLRLPTQGEICVPTAFNELLLTAKDGGRKVDLTTIHQKQRTYRLTFKSEPADPAAFLRAWDASFDWEMMRYPVLTRIAEGRQLYLQGNRFQVRNLTEVQRAEVDPAMLVERIAREFGIAPVVAAKALTILERRGETHGSAAAS